MRKAQYARITECWHYQTDTERTSIYCTSLTVAYYGHIPTELYTREIIKMALPVHHLSEFYPYAKLKPKEINFDRDTWLKDPMSRLHADTVQRTGSRIFIRQHVLRWPPLMSTREQRTIDSSCISAGIWEATWYWQTGDRPGDVESAGDRRRTAISTATARRAYGRTDGRQWGRQCCICQVVGDGQVVRRQTCDDRTVGCMDEFYHYSDGSPTVRSVKQWDGNRAVGWSKTDSGSLVRSENTVGGNGPPIEPSHGHFVACQKINFHTNLKKGVDLYV